MIEGLRWQAAFVRGPATRNANPELTSPQPSGNLGSRPKPARASRRILDISMNAEGDEMVGGGGGERSDPWVKRYRAVG